MVLLVAHMPIHTALQMPSSVSQVSRLPMSGTTQASNQAGVAVFFGDGTVITSCVSFSESSLTGLELLQRSGLSIETATNPNQGTAVCKIGDVGSPSADCFGSMPNYWSYWQLGEDGWAYAVVGADQSQVVDGDVNAWSWGEGDAPVLISYQNICEAVPFVMPEATQTSIPPTDTPQPTHGRHNVPTVVQPQPTATTEVSSNECRHLYCLWIHYYCPGCVDIFRGAFTQ